MVLHSPGISDDLYSGDPAVRRRAAVTAGRRARRTLLRRAASWPENSPGAINAWLLLVTTKPPRWRDPFVQWRELPLTFGTPHEGFFYPDPIGFWAEVRRWATVIGGVAEEGVATSNALATSALMHVGDDPSRLRPAIELLQPEVILFLDEVAWEAAAMPADTVPFAIPDPHRPKVVYQGCWGTSGRRVVGKSPQHPAAHQLYGAHDMTSFLRAVPFATR